MFGSRFTIIFAFSLMSILPISNILADAPGERFHVTMADSIEQALIETIGIMTINAKDYREPLKEFGTYVKTDSGFAYSGNLNPLSETIPVSNFGYSTDSAAGMVSNYRYPIIEKADPYVLIIIEPTNNKQVWVNYHNLDSNYSVFTVMIDSLQSASKYYVDIFCFTHSGNRKVYNEPGNDSKFKIFSRKGLRLGPLKILEQKDDFIKISGLALDPSGHWIEKPIGWVRIHDDEGMLLVWLKYADLC